MENAGFWSLLPPIIAIVLAIRTRQVFVSLLFGIWLGWLVLGSSSWPQDWAWYELPGLVLGQLWTSFLATLQALVDVFKDAGNTRTIMFCTLVGALIIFIQRSGGVVGFIRWISKRLEDDAGKGTTKDRKLVGSLAWLTGLLIFVESSISVLTVGALYRPLFDKLKMSREKLAYLADSSSAPSSILIPFNGWGAFIMGLLAAQGFADPFATMAKSILFNFYPFLALGLALYVARSNWHIGPMKAAEARVKETGELFPPGGKPMVSEELTEVEVAPGVTPKASNMVLPIVMMVLLMPVMLAYTGWSSAMETMPDASRIQQFFFAIGQGSGSTSVLVAVTCSLLFSMLLYRSQRIMGFKEMIELTLKGISGMVPLALLMLLAFAIGGVCKQLGTGLYVAELTREWLSPSLVPFLVFLVSCFIAFSTGTSWGTFAIMIAIAVPMSRELGADMSLAIAAALGGGVFGDHCSPISDTSIISSMASATDHIAHVRTQLPYALIAGAGAALLYLIFGFAV